MEPGRPVRLSYPGFGMWEHMEIERPSILPFRNPSQGMQIGFGLAWASIPFLQPISYTRESQ
jgi:hypothetical protein